MRGFGKIKGGLSLPATTAVNSAVYGIYSLAEAEGYRKLGLWPTAPTVPGIPTNLVGTSGDSQVSLSWSAPTENGGAAITDYVVQYSSDGGSIWETFSRSASVVTSAVVTSLLNGTSYLFRVAAVNSVGAGSPAVSNAIVPDVISVLTITTQPKNDYTENGSQNITFSIAATGGGGEPTYQWQYFGPNEEANEYDYIWRNIPGATTATYTTNGNTMAGTNLLSYGFYYEGGAKLRCIVRAAVGDAELTSDIVRFLQLDQLHSLDSQWSGNQGSSLDYGTYPLLAITPVAGESVVLRLDDLSMVSLDNSWYTGNDVTVKIQVATTGHTALADWTDLYAVDQRGYASLFDHIIAPDAGTKYYRVIAVHIWPYAVNNGTQSVTHETPYVWPTYNALKVTWPAAGYTVSGTADYSGSYPTSGTLSSGSAAWQHVLANYILVWNDTNSGWGLFPGTIADGQTGGPIAWQACGFPGGGGGTCVQAAVTGTYALTDGSGSITVT